MNVAIAPVRLPALVLAALILPTLAFAEPLVASHRGSVSQVAENTLAAFRWAEIVGADLVEADLRVAGDESLVVIHDARVDRTTNGRGKVRELPLSKLKALDAGDGQPIPTIDETLAFVRSSGIQLLLDVKDSEQIDAESLVAAIERQGMRERVLIGSRSLKLAGALKSIEPELKVLAMVPDAGAIQDFLALDVDGVRLWARWTRRNPRLVEEVREAGVQVWVMTGGLKGRPLQRALRVADGVITNHPSEALHISLSAGR